MGFFFLEEKTNQSKRGVSIETLHKMECEACPLNEADLSTPKMSPSGSIEPLAYCLAEAPGKWEDIAGEPLVGESGTLLKRTLVEPYLKLEGHNPFSASFDEIVNPRAKEIFRFNNVVRSRPPQNRNPTWQEIECCRPSIVRDIEEIKPKAIFGFGNVPLNWALGLEGITRWRGRRVPVQIGSHKCWYFPMLHPSAILRQLTGRYSEEIEKDLYYCLFRSDIRNATRIIDDLPEPEIEDPDKISDGIEIYECFDERELKQLKKALEEFHDYPEIAIDLETNDLRPYNSNAKILSCSIGTYDRAISFPIRHSRARKSFQGKLTQILIDFLKTNKSAKIAHNLSFELEWLIELAGKDIVDSCVWHDTMGQAYVLDSRKGALSLDDVCLERLFLHLKDYSNVSRTNLDNENLRAVLHYNALDTKYEHKVFELQRDDIEREGLDSVYKEQRRRVPTLVLTQIKGLHVDQNEVKSHKKILEKQINGIIKKINSQKPVLEFSKAGKRFNPASHADVLKVFKEILRRPETQVAENKFSANEDVLSKIDHELADLILEYRTLSGIKSKYIDPLEAPDGKYLFEDKRLHPQLKPHNTATRRLSSSGPNEQNFPKREHREIRSVITVPKNHVFVACDYGALEARVIAMASQDKNLIKAMWERYDIHMDWAERIAAASPEVVGGRKALRDKDEMKKFRDKIKNTFVFPLFYGSWYKSIANDVGIDLYKAKNHEKEFWKMFPDLKGWQEREVEFYRENGYTETLAGFRCPGPLKRTKIINYKSQGTGAEICVDAMCQLSELSRSTDREQLQPILNVHDDLSFSIPEKTLDEDLETIIHHMLQPQYDFVKAVPLTIEVEMGPNWYELEEVGEFSSDEL